ncbi:hypothetical protein [Spirochaeta dissipatitropha]
MRRKIFLAALAGIFAAVTVSAQSLNDNFNTMSGWTPAAGQWSIQNGHLVQNSTQESMARIDRKVNTRGNYRIELPVQYIGGGYASNEDLRNGIYHGGFGIHLGVAEPATGKRSWGNGDSYLLWINLDTRPETRRNAPEHFGIRAQIYRSHGNSQMTLVSDPRIRQDPVMSKYAHGEYASINLEAMLQDAGLNLQALDIAETLTNGAVLNLEVNPANGRISIRIPGLNGAITFTVPEPAALRGDYVSLRTNKLSTRFDYFRLTEL